MTVRSRMMMERGGSEGIGLEFIVGSGYISRVCNRSDKRGAVTGLVEAKPAEKSKAKVVEGWCGQLF